MIGSPLTVATTCVRLVGRAAAGAGAGAGAAAFFAGAVWARDGPSACDGQEPQRRQHQQAGTDNSRIGHVSLTIDGILREGVAARPVCTDYTDSSNPAARIRQ